MLEWANEAVRAYEKREEEREQQRLERHKSLAVAVSLLLGTTVPPQGNTVIVYYLENMAGKFLFKFSDVSPKQVCIVAICDKCKGQFQVPVPTRADLGEIFVKGLPEHTGCSIP